MIDPKKDPLLNNGIQPVSGKLADRILNNNFVKKLYSKRNYGIIAIFAVVSASLIGYGFLAQTSRSSLLKDISNHKYQTAIKYVVDKGIFDGYSDNTFRPDDIMQRASFAMASVKSVNLPVTESEITTFTDLGPDDPNNLFPHDYISVASKNSIVQGKTSTTFAPYDNITLAQTTTIIVRAFNNVRPGTLAQPPTSYNSRFGNFSSTHQENMRWADYNGLLSGLTITDPNKQITRAEAAQIFYSVVKLYESKFPIPSTPPPVTPPTIVEYDVIVYGLNISTAGFVNAIRVNDARAEDQKVKVAIITSASQNQTEQPGVYLTDNYEEGDGKWGATTNGFYKKLVDTNTSYFKLNKTGDRPITTKSGMDTVISNFVNKQNVTIYYGSTLSSLKYTSSSSSVDIVTGGKTITLKAKSMVDLSPTADLAMKLSGINYMVGKSNTVYSNSSSSTKAPLPTSSNKYITAPQAIAMLPTIKDYGTGKVAPKIENLGIPNYVKSSYKASDFAGYDLSKFKTSGISEGWSWNTAVLYDSSLRELNQPPYTNLVSATDAYNYYFGTADQRQSITNKAVQRSLNFIRYIQSKYPNIGLKDITPIYVRGGLRILGLDTYTTGDLVNKTKREVVATGYYAEYDWHNAETGSSVHEGYKIAYIPYKTIFPKNFPNVMVVQAASVDYRVSASPFRMEPQRANLGYVAGLISWLADTKNKKPNEIAYKDVQTYLLKQNFKLQ